MYSQRLTPQHFQELVSGSRIDPHLASLNFFSLEGNYVYEYLFIAASIERTNPGRVCSGWLRRYAQMTLGGWWCAGADPFNSWQEMEWGCFKPNSPRQNAEGKIIKYEHPPKTPTRIFCLRVPLHIWQQVAWRYNLAMPENIVISEVGEALGFWQWVVDKNIPIIICEGAKKAAALLSCGYVAIAIPGINSSYRVVRDFEGRIIDRQLIPDLMPFTEFGRNFYICFDYETQPKKKRLVENAIAHLGYLLLKQNCAVKVIQLPGIEKGVDDFIVAQNPDAFEAVYAASLDLETHLAKAQPHTELTYPAALTLNQRYLANIPFPPSGLVGIKSAKGTGKTTAVAALIKDENTKDKPVLLISHRIQLGRFLSEKIGINWISNYQLPITNADSLGLCIDSIWKLNPENWRGGIVILDEVEQCLWHLLHSETCKDKRIKLLRVFQQLIATVLQTGGLVIAGDADLSDLSLDYLKRISGMPINPWVVINEWQPQGWDVTFYDSPNPTLLIHQLEQDLLAGKKCYVTTDSRSGRYSPETIDRYIKQRLEQFQKRYPTTLVVSSKTTNTPGHAAIYFVEKINDKAKDYDAVFTTPSLGTGVSIDIEHFDRVYGIFQGVIPDREARQALARVRSNVPRIIWCAKRGIGLIASGSKNYRVLAYWYQENQKENLALISPIPQIEIDLPLVIDLIHLRTWAKFAARVNASICLYRPSMLNGLISEGHQVNIVSETPPKDQLTKLRQELLAAVPKNRDTARKLVLEIFRLQKQYDTANDKAKVIKQKVREIKRKMELGLADAIANAPDISSRQYKYLLSQRNLTDSEQNQIDKYLLQKRYGIEVTPQLKLKDDRGYYWQILTHYYLTCEREYFRLKDRQEWAKHLATGDGKVFLPDLKTYTLKIEALRALNLPQFLQVEREFTETDADIIELKAKAIDCSKHIYRALGVNIPSEAESAIKILGQLLKLLGLKLKKIQPQVYKIDSETLKDGREIIFEYWQNCNSLNWEDLSLTLQVPETAKVVVS